jgi:hypothetical protein
MTAKYLMQGPSCRGWRIVSRQLVYASSQFTPLDDQVEKCPPPLVIGPLLRELIALKGLDPALA